MLWGIVKDKLQRCFSEDKTRVHSATLLNGIRKQETGESIRVYIHEFLKKHYQATSNSLQHCFKKALELECTYQVSNSVNMVRPTVVLHRHHEEDDDEICELNQIEIIKRGIMLIGNVMK